jgi:dTDP-4-amino-4,6-dideoxygalactose transaminase
MRSDEFLEDPAPDLAIQVVASAVPPAPAVCITFADAAACAAAQRALAENCLESRLWYGWGMHHQPYFAALAWDALPCTDRLAPAVLGLPMAPDLWERDAHRVVSQVAAALDCDSVSD